MRRWYRWVATSGVVGVLAGCSQVETTCGPGDRYRDRDGDGAGAGTLVTACVEGQRYAPLADDCDDDSAEVGPDAEEVCDGVDNDCNGIVDEGVASRTWFRDADGDGFGSEIEPVRACEAPNGDWRTQAGDCDDGDATVNPDSLEVCGDGVDQDCDGSDQPCNDARSSCRDVLAANPVAPSGVYSLDIEGETFDAWCDMDTDEGGWTLVASSAGAGLRDISRFYYNDVQTLFPASSHNGTWGGMREVVDPSHDLRFACKAVATEPAMTVDLSFYDVTWYHVITTGLDSQSCFEDAEGTNTTKTPPARRNNLNGEERMRGIPFESGSFHGEDRCNDLDDFTVDFDAGGADRTASDLTDWGKDDGATLCGSSIAPEDGAWFIFVR